jgi:hypothetical protein
MARYRCLELVFFLLGLLSLVCSLIDSANVYGTSVVRPWVIWGMAAV